MSAAAVLFLVGALGLSLGSFFNVLIYRLPLDQSIVKPGSHCPSCNHAIGPWENIPVISYLVLRGKCRWCKASISLQYPAVELLTGFAALVIWLFYVLPLLSASATPWQTIVIVVQGLALLTMIPMTIIDARHYIIPDILTVPGAIAAVALSFLPGGLSPLQSALGVLVGGGSLWGVGLLGSVLLKKKDAMGGGDVRLMAFVGGLWGWQIALVTIFAASVLGTIGGLGLMAGKKLNQDHKLPFGPFLAAGTWVAVLLMHWASKGQMPWFGWLPTP